MWKREHKPRVEIKENRISSNQHWFRLSGLWCGTVRALPRQPHHRHWDMAGSQPTAVKRQVTAALEAEGPKMVFALTRKEAST